MVLLIELKNHSRPELKFLIHYNGSSNVNGAKKVTEPIKMVIVVKTDGKAEWIIHHSTAI